MKAIFTLCLTLFSIASFSQSGVPDSTFSGDGAFVALDNVTNGYHGGTNAIAVQPDGKILLAGYGNTHYIRGKTNDFSIIRLNSDGSFDNSFGDSGHVFIKFTDEDSESGEIKGIRLQPDGKIVVAGNVVYTYNNFIDSINATNYSDIGVARLNTNGSLDISFNGTGKELIDLMPLIRDPNKQSWSQEDCNALAIRQDGKMILAGEAFNNKGTSNDADVLIVQLNPNGTPDKTFKSNGVQIFKKTGTSENVLDMTLQSDNRIIITGSSKSSLLVARVNPNGNLDKTFANTGYIVTDIQENIGGSGTSVLTTKDGKILIGGFSDGGAFQPLTFLMRYTITGTLDKTFGQNGKAISNDPKLYRGEAIAIQSDGKILQACHNFYIVRYLPNGSIDSTFGSFGRTIAPLPYVYYSYCAALALQPDQKVIIAGTAFFSTDEAGGYTDGAARLLTTGQGYSLQAPSDTTIDLNGDCSIILNDIDPIVTPDTDTTFSNVKYYVYDEKLNYPNLIDSGTGSASGREFDVNTTTRITYVSTINPYLTSSFVVTVTGDTKMADALNFDGIDDRVELHLGSNVFGPAQTYTFESWIRVKSYNNDGGSVIFGNNRNRDSGIVVALTPTGYIATYSPKLGNVISSQKIPLNTWTHIAFAQQVDTLYLYVNGENKGPLLSGRSVLHADTKNTYYLGSYTDDGVTFSRHFDGDMDNIRIWRVGLFEDQLQAYLHCTLGHTDGSQLSQLVADFNCNQGHYAGCNNTNSTTLETTYIKNVYNTYGVLQNFTLKGPVSNFIAGNAPISGECEFIPQEPIQFTDVIQYISVPTDLGICGAVVNFTVSKASSPYTDSIPVVYSSPSGTTFPKGTTTVHAQATDVTGAVGSFDFDVNVYDGEPPTLATRDTIVRLDENGNAVVKARFLVKSVSDNCSATENIKLNSSKSIFTTQDIGANMVTVQATDQWWNSSTKMATVTVLPYSAAEGSDAIQAGVKSSPLNRLTAVAMPNPSRDYFRVQVKSSDSRTEISFIVTDLSGRTLNIFHNLKDGTIINFGSRYKAGTYFAVLAQGDIKKVIKIIKL